MRILVADDDAGSWHRLSSILNDAGHTPLWARDAMQAAVLAESHRPDLLLLDIRLPTREGIDALVHLKGSALTASIPVVVMSELRDVEVEREALRDGALVFLHKPVAADVLLGTIARVSAAEPPA